MKKKGVVLFVILVSFFIYKGCKKGDSPSEQPDKKYSPTAHLNLTFRDQLTFSQLIRGEEMIDLIHNDYFIPIGETTPSSVDFEGTLTLTETRMNTPHPQTTWEGRDFTYFPGLILSIIKFKNWFIPVQRGIIFTGEINRSVWNIIVSPGRVWKEPDDNGYSRASFPFTLCTNGVGQARNGLATFVFENKTISHIYVQITQETAPIDDYHPAQKFSAMVPVQYNPHPVPLRNEIITTFQTELDQKLPLLPWSALPDSENLKNIFNSELENEAELSMGVLMVNGSLYIQVVPSHTGPYPYPEFMRHGVFSCTKTIVGGISMFFLAEKYGEEIFQSLISEYVPALAQHPGWEGVTFSHTLNMVSGTHGSDEGNDIYPFIMARSMEEKIQTIANLADAPPEPGTTFNYASTNFFALSYAMNQLVKSREGEDANYWHMVAKEVLEPIGITHFPVQLSIETNGQPGIPTTGWGAYPNVDDAAKIAQLLQNEGRFNGIQLLNRNKVQEALGRNAWQGFVSNYKHSLWQEAVTLPQCFIIAPTMMGHGGNLISILPSGINIIRFYDNNDYNTSPMTRAAENIRTSCSNQ